MSNSNFFQSTRDDGVAPLYARRPRDAGAEGLPNPAAMKGSQARPAAEDVVSMDEVMRALWRGMGVIAGAIALCLLAAWIYAERVATPQYAATAVLVLEPSGDHVVDFADTREFSTDVAAINTQTGILRGRDFISDIVRSEQLLDDPEFNPARTPRGPELTDARQLEIATNLLLSSLSVRAVPNSLILEVRVETGDPEKSARIADAIAETYVQNQLQRKISETREAQAWLAARLAELQGKLEVAEGAVQDFRFDDTSSNRPQEMVRFEQLKSDAETLRGLYQSFLTRLRETSVEEGLHTPDSRVLSHAVAPRGPSSPDKVLIFGAAGIAGLIAGLLLVLLREARRKTVLDSRELERTVGHAVLGEIPDTGAPRKRWLPWPESRRARVLFDTSIDVLRSNIAFNGGEVLPAAIMVTSAVPEEGKSTVIEALAESAARSGATALVIDADLQQRRLSRQWGNTPHARLENVIAGTADLSEAAAPLGESGAHILCSGAGRAMSSIEALSSEGFQKLVEDAVSRYKYVFIDVPPVLVAPDAQTVAQTADRVLLLTRWGRTPAPLVQEAATSLEMAAFRPIGLGLSFVPPRHMTRRQFGDYYAEALRIAR